MPVWPVKVKANLATSSCDSIEKHGNRALTIPGHYSPFEIRIFNDVVLNRGPDTRLFCVSQVRTKT